MLKNTNTTVASPTAGKSKKVGIIVVTLAEAAKASQKSTQTFHFSKMVLFMIKRAEVQRVHRQGYLVIVVVGGLEKNSIQGNNKVVESSVVVGEPVFPNGWKR